MIAMQQTSGILLSSAFHSRAELHGTLEEVRRALADIPGMQLASTGTRLRYAILDSKNCNEAEAMAEFASDCITFRFFFKTPSSYEFRRNFMRFVAILAYLKDIYTVKLSDLYCYTIEALRPGQDAALPPGGGVPEEIARARMRALGSVNASLSRALSLADKRLREKDMCIASYNAFSKAIIAGLAERNGKEAVNAADSLCAFGVDKALADEILLLVAGVNKR